MISRVNKIPLFILLLTFTCCSKSQDRKKLLIGTWKEVKIETEDGIPYHNYYMDMYFTVDSMRYIYNGIPEPLQTYTFSGDTIHCKSAVFVVEKLTKEELVVLDPNSKSSDKKRIRGYYKKEN
jgi:hypothetical protein